ncbi:MAG: methylmalonyl-CoA mutase [Spirochaetaceae bacterium]|nr:MAG: methylmalonyl-CoA mutase [Spirochaetaceae bacterium]
MSEPIDLEQLETARREWDKTVLTPALEKNPGRDEAALRTASNIPLQPLYDPTSDNPATYLERQGFPGCYPFTRGVQPTMYRGRLWTMRQYAGFGTAEQTNARFRYLLDQGQTGLSVAFDLPTQVGLDSDHSLALGEVGKVGVAIDTLRDMEALLAEIPLDEVSTSMTINAPAAVLLAMYIVVAESQDADWSKLRGTIQNDILKEYVARGTYIFPPGPSMRLIQNTFEFCARKLPKWNSISVSGYHIREAGATAVQEVAFTLADAIAYVETALQAGLNVDEFAGGLSFFFSAGSDLLEEVAKFRAARRMWARIMKQRFGAQSPRSMTLRFHSQTSGAALTAQQPDNNVARVTLHALAAVLGGTQSLHTNSRDEALALPSQESVQIALRTQQILAHESGVANTVDPLAGSYVVEALTDEIEAQAHDYLERIASMGGMVQAIEAGYVQREIADAAYTYQRQLEDGKRIVVGVNRFTTADEPHRDLMRHDPGLREAQLARLADVRFERNEQAVLQALRALRNAAEQPGENLMYPIIDCVRRYATLGEICAELRRVFGEHTQPGVV